jgi:peptidoglycan/LPS O-acetylase OafA/YrhL
VVNQIWGTLLSITLLRSRALSNFPRPSKAIGSRKGPGLRRDIQGLRAFAVLAVIADHLFHWPSGGFIGVDVFFVISGFLITGLLLREYDRTGRISFSNFYRRRIKRILPASVLVLTVTLASTYFVLSKSRFEAVATDVGWSFLFAGNWRFASSGTDYFQASGPVSPVQHFWSLAVEEQFYFIWPLLMVLIFSGLARMSHRSISVRVAVGAVIASISVASFLWALLQTDTAPTQAYFSTFTRAWELGIGATLAVAAPLLGRIPAVTRPLVAWAGIIGMSASLFVINGTSPFPAPAAALPVLSAALVIAAGIGGEQKFLAPLTNRVSGYLGDISYSLYLWHFPVIILTGTFVDLEDPRAVLLVLASILVLSAYSFHLVEDPIRRSNWLAPGVRQRIARRIQGKRVRPNDNRPPLADRKYGMTLLSLLAVVTAVVVAAALQTPKPPAVAASIPVTPSLSKASETKAPKLASLQTGILSALRQTSWPPLTPSMDDAIGSEQAPSDVLPCGLVPNLVDTASCSWGSKNATKKAVIVGDSVAMTYVSPFRKVLEGKKDWRLYSYGTFGCTFAVDDYPSKDPQINDWCPQRKADAVKAINDMHPDVVFITNAYGPRTLPGQTKPMASQDEWQASLRALVDQFAGNVGKVVFLAAPPADADIASCYTRSSQPADCITNVSSGWEFQSSAEQNLASKYRNALWVDSTPWFCAFKQCPSFVGATPVKSDANHMTVAYGTKIAPVMLETLMAQDILD